MSMNCEHIQIPADTSEQSSLCRPVCAQPADALLSWEGRVEHLTSGQVLRFHAPEELLAFLTRVLTEVQEPSCIA